jgi:release factor glutamine methyltransferase
MRALDKLRKAKALLTNSGIDDADREAESIIAHCLGIDRLILYRDNPELHDGTVVEINELLKRRARREPLQYILGYAEFHGLKIKVGRGVLIPRPETELLVEEAVKILKEKALGIAKLRALDLCTGSGCIALALAKEFPEAGIYGTDTSEVAIEYAVENAAINGLRNVTFLKGSLFEPLRSAAPKLPVVFDLIVSNPPYIKRDDMKHLQPEIREWEPAEALDGGEDGLDYYRMMIPEAGFYLRENGSLLLEIGAGQAEDIKEMAADAGFLFVSLIKDYAGIERILIARLI